MNAQPDALAEALPGRRNRIQGIAWQSQNANQWCWAACCVMIAEALGLSRLPGGLPLTQCGVVALTLGRAPEALCRQPANRLSGACANLDCTEDGAREIGGVVSETLRRMLPPDMPVAHSIHGLERIDDAEIRAMIDRGHPVAVLCDIPTRRGGGRNHYVLIIGYDTGRGEYTVWDPDPSHGLRRISRGRWYELGTWVGAVVLRDPG
jgi:hypothetical protein